VIALLDRIRSLVGGQDPRASQLASFLSARQLGGDSRRPVPDRYEWGEVRPPTRAILERVLPCTIFPCMNRLRDRRTLDWIISMRREIRALGRTLGSAVGAIEEALLVELGLTTQRWELVDLCLPHLEYEGILLRVLEYYAVAGDALDVLRDVVSNPQRQRCRHPRQKDLFGRCRLCWRYGAPYRKGYHYCEEHRPLTTNADYKEQLRLFWWHRRPLELPFVGCVKSAPDRRYRARCRREPSDIAMSALLRGIPVPLGDFPRRAIGLPRCLARLPYLSRELGERKVPLKSALAILRALDPINDSEKDRCRLHRLLHLVCARDQHHLWAMLTWAEAWFAASSRRHGHWGGACDRGSYATERRRRAKAATSGARG